MRVLRIRVSNIGSESLKSVAIHASTPPCASMGNQLHHLQEKDLDSCDNRQPFGASATFQCVNHEAHSQGVAAHPRLHVSFRRPQATSFSVGTTPSKPCAFRSGACQNQGHDKPNESTTISFALIPMPLLSLATHR
jgi:hypothetical protein